MYVNLFIYLQFKHDYVKMPKPLTTNGILLQIINKLFLRLFLQILMDIFLNDAF